MAVNEALDALVAQRQAKCEHPYQDRIEAGGKTFCGLCGKEEK